MSIKFELRKVVGMTDFKRESFLEKAFNFLPPFQQTALTLSLSKREGDRGSKSGYLPAGRQVISCEKPTYQLGFQESISLIKSPERR